MPTKKPTPTSKTDTAAGFIRIRIWTRTDQVEEMADWVADRLERAGLVLLDQSPPFPCRRPNEHESRVYLSFYPPPRNVIPDA